MKRGAQYAASWSGAALLSLVLTFAAMPAAASASTTPPEVTPTGESTQSASDGSDGAQGSEPSAADSTSPEATNSPAPADPTGAAPADPIETATPDPAETATPDPSQTPAEPTPTPDQPATPSPEPSTPTSPEPSLPPSQEPSPDPSELPDQPRPSEPAGTPAPESPAGDYLRCGSAFAGPGETETLRLDMSRGLTDLSAGSSLAGATISIVDGVVYYQAPSPLPRGSSQDDFAVRGQTPDGISIQARCYVGLQASVENDIDPDAPGTAPLNPTRAAQTEETPDGASSTPGSASPGSSSPRTGLDGPPIPGMPGYLLPELTSSPSPAATEAAEGSQPAAGAADSPEDVLAQTGFDTLRVFIAVALAVLAIIAGATALLLSSRRARSTK